MCELAFVKNPAASEVLMSEWGPRSQRGCRFGHPPRPGAIDLPPVALEAEGVVPVRTNLTAILESGFPLLARRAQGPDALRPTVKLLARHRRPPGRSRPAPCFDSSRVSREADRSGHTSDVRLDVPAAPSRHFRRGSRFSARSMWHQAPAGARSRHAGPYRAQPAAPVAATFPPCIPVCRQSVTAFVFRSMRQFTRRAAGRGRGTASASSRRSPRRGPAR